MFGKKIYDQLPIHIQNQAFVIQLVHSILASTTMKLAKIWKLVLKSKQSSD